MISFSNAYDVIVVGSGPAGQNAALEAAECGARVLMVEQEPRPGGACVQYGTIPSKTLRETAVTLSAFQRRSGDVYRISQDAQLSIASLMKRLSQVVTAHQDTTHRCLESAGIRQICGQARFLSPHELLITQAGRSGMTVTGDIMVIATGSRPRSPASVNVDHENILDSDSVLSMSYLPKSLLILGGGVIACEYASTFAALGVRVTMVDRAARPLGFMDAELVEFFLSQLRIHHGEFHGLCELGSLQWDDVSSVRLQLTDGRQFQADKAFIALGRVANVDRLGLEHVGLQISDRGLLDVNEFCQTVVPHVYAVGDTIGPPALASSAMEQGRRAMRHALGRPSAARLGIIPTGIYTIPEIASVGLTERQAAENGRQPRVTRVTLEHVARAQIMAADSGMLKLIADADGQELLGVQIVGDGATELIHIGQLALMSGMTIEQLAQTTFNFPTMAEAYRLAALQIRDEVRKSTSDTRSLRMPHSSGVERDSVHSGSC